MNVAREAIDDQGIAGFNQIDDIGNVSDGRDAERASYDRDMAQRAGFLENQPRIFARSYSKSAAGPMERATMTEL